MTDYVRTERLTSTGVSASLVAAAAAAISTPKPSSAGATTPRDRYGSAAAPVLTPRDSWESRNLREVEDVYGKSVLAPHHR